MGTANCVVDTGEVGKPMLAVSETPQRVMLYQVRAFSPAQKFGGCT